MPSCETQRVLKKLRAGPKDEYEFSSLQDVLKGLPIGDREFLYYRLKGETRELWFSNWQPENEE